MESSPVVHSTFVIERACPAEPDRAFAAFADAERKRRWYTAGENHTVHEYSLDFRVGGVERWSATFDEGTPFAGTRLASYGVYLDIVPASRIVLASDMQFGGRRISVALITIELAPEEQGARLFFTHQGAFFEGADGPEMREEGWHKLLNRLGDEFQAAPAER